MNEFGDYLRELRGKMSLRDAAKKTGLSHSYIRDLELGKKTDPSNDSLLKLANSYGVNYEQLQSAKFDNLIYRKYLIDKLEILLIQISVNNEFLPEYQDFIDYAKSIFDDSLESDVEFTPDFLRKLVSEADWRQEWINELINVIDNGLRLSGLNKKDLHDFLSLPNISYKNIPINDYDKKLIEVYLDTLLSNRLMEEDKK
jgi:transcriptional regulator with XRE-family HTH domain